jgi:hypothetical protein
MGARLVVLYGIMSIVAINTGTAARMEAEKFRNDKVVVTERTLDPGQSDQTGEYPSVTVFFEPGSFQVASPGGKSESITVTRGDVRYMPAKARTMKNRGSTPLHFVRIDLTGPGGSEMWGTTGLAPHYKLLTENQYARVYDIRIPAHTNEPQHSHKDRVVVCLSGAKLKHRYPDGREEPSTLKTGESAWRRGSTHIGQNLGDTDLWVIAVEPK